MSGPATGTPAIPGKSVIFAGMKKENNSGGGPLQIDLGAVLAAKGIRVPGVVLGAAERLLCVRQLNGLLREAYPAHGSAFGRRIAGLLDISINVNWDEVTAAERTGMITADTPVVFVSNHPLGGMDGIALLTVLGERYGDESIRCPVNDLLMAVEPLRDMFLPVNKYGSQARRSASAINAAWGNPAIRMLMFPAGLVSRQKREGDVIEDLEWQKSFVVKALATGRTVIPVRFYGENSLWFYRVARWRKRWGIKVNVEQAMLPGQLFYQRGRTLSIRFLRPVSPEALYELGDDDRQRAMAVSMMVSAARHCR